MIAAFALCLSPIVVDGDTLRCKGVEKSVRLAGIDAPDKTCKGRRKANCSTILDNGIDSKESASALTAVLKGKAIKIRYYKSETYGRRIGAVCAGKVNISKYMVDNGYANYKPNWNGAGVRVKCY